MKFFVVAFLIFIFVFCFYNYFRKIKKQQSKEIDIVTCIRVALGDASQDDMDKYAMYMEQKDKEDKEQQNFKDKIEKAKNENQSIEQIMLIWNELTKKYPYYDYFLEKAELYLENKLYDKAFSEYKKAIKSIDKREFYQCESYVYHLISKMYFDICDYRKAIKFASKAIKVHKGGYVYVNCCSEYCPFSPLEYSKEMAYQDRAEIFFKLKKHDLALKDLNKAMND